ncbi:hypothetical protein Pmani_024030 [Petrolisthes manimaculis]|uniref:Uncharacterized protein n=1 Tax=Petrolisthes manimaculis TaxID=1843537 RepID=A0AAE1U2P7_9EUCA|nr:hypothetical protein Pmani_024030 [Petrolisthes manimaculis]
MRSWKKSVNWVKEKEKDRETVSSGGGGRVSGEGASVSGGGRRVSSGGKRCGGGRVSGGGGKVSSGGGKVSSGGGRSVRWRSKKCGDDGGMEG